MPDLHRKVSRILPTQALQRFLELESAGGIILLLAATLALAWANLPVAGDWYRQFLAIRIELRIGALALHKNVLLLINDGLMAIFFLLVALEIKREILEGDLSSFGQIVLPSIAAAGGVILPAAIYAAINWGNAMHMRGWAIPSATDIAFSLGVLSLLGSRAPASLKIFLTTVAVVDDLAAIVIIALFYTANLSALALIMAGSCLVVLIALNLLGVRSLIPYFIVGFVLWLCVLKSGVHATLAGVALGFCVPLRGGTGEKKAPLHVVENALHPWVAFAILPLFAFANAGISFSGLSGSVFTSTVSLGILAGLAIGKPIGVMAGAVLCIRSGLARLPDQATWRAMFGVAILAGIGFTMSLFIGNLAFRGGDPELDVATRIGVFGGSILTAVVGLLYLHLVLPPRNHQAENSAPRH